MKTLIKEKNKFQKIAGMAIAMTAALAMIGLATSCGVKRPFDPDDVETELETQVTPEWTPSSWQTTTAYADQKYITQLPPSGAPDAGPYVYRYKGGFPCQTTNVVGNQISFVGTPVERLTDQDVTIIEDAPACRANQAVRGASLQVCAGNTLISFTAFDQSYIVWSPREVELSALQKPSYLEKMYIGAVDSGGRVAVTERDMAVGNVMFIPKTSDRKRLANFATLCPTPPPTPPPTQGFIDMVQDITYKIGVITGGYEESFILDTDNAETSIVDRHETLGYYIADASLINEVPHVGDNQSRNLYFLGVDDVASGMDKLNIFRGGGELKFDFAAGIDIEECEDIQIFGIKAYGLFAEFEPRDGENCSLSASKGVKTLTFTLPKLVVEAVISDIKDAKEVTKNDEFTSADNGRVVSREITIGEEGRISAENWAKIIDVQNIDTAAQVLLMPTPEVSSNQDTHHGLLYVVNFPPHDRDDNNMLGVKYDLAFVNYRLATHSLYKAIAAPFTTLVHWSSLYGFHREYSSIEQAAVADALKNIEINVPLMEAVVVYPGFGEIVPNGIDPDVQGGINYQSFPIGEIVNFSTLGAVYDSSSYEDSIQKEKDGNLKFSYRMSFNDPHHVEYVQGTNKHNFSVVELDDGSLVKVDRESREFQQIITIVLEPKN